MIMKASEYKRLRNGSRVKHVDGTLGTIEINPHFSVITEIVWDDGQRQIVRTDSKTDLAWVETDVESAE